MDRIFVLAEHRMLSRSVVMMKDVDSVAHHAHHQQALAITAALE